jgi:hypothetical protein
MGQSAHLAGLLERLRGPSGGFTRSHARLAAFWQ